MYAERAAKTIAAAADGIGQVVLIGLPSLRRGEIARRTAERLADAVLDGDDGLPAAFAHELARPAAEREEATALTRLSTRLRSGATVIWDALHAASPATRERIVAIGRQTGARTLAVSLRVPVGDGCAHRGDIPRRRMEDMAAALAGLSALGLEAEGFDLAIELTARPEPGAPIEEETR
jgi:hypothetical protein